ncbi:1,3-beta-glucan synthase subunit FKS1-like, domain-1 [Dillenia turbinata]|uniref:1,3-beta-glucan synthase n=1 Tax=Dillenia turbinata TaxID=194707 RepID=A0AAN8W5K8_9MAGN
MSEIVAAEPINLQNTKPKITTSSVPSSRKDVPEPFDSERLPPTLASEIRSFLRVANQIEIAEPRRFHAFEVAHNLDHNSSGRGVRQFKTSLLQRLEQDEEATTNKRKEKSDMRELRRVYREYTDYISRHSGEIDQETRNKLINARAIASVLHDVLRTVRNAAGPQAPVVNDNIKVMPYNILPLDQGSLHHAIMQFPEIKAGVAAIRNIRGLPDFQKIGTLEDMFDWLHALFSFQKGNVANQREHLILLLANAHIRQSSKQTPISKLGDGAVDELMRKFFKNYTNWCKFLGKKSNIRLPYAKEEVFPNTQQYKLLYIGLYLLIWGEAANLRFMPECLCFIFHHMAYELHSLLVGAINKTTGERIMPAYGGESEFSFLNNVVTPIYMVIYKEAQECKNGTADHSTWRNYDDLNESPSCFEIGWPLRLDHNFFFVSSQNSISKPQTHQQVVQDKKTTEGNEEEEQVGTEKEGHQRSWLGKTNFVELRSFWHIFRSFDRMWSFFIISLQALIIMACHDVGSPLQIFDAIIFEDILSIFITSAILRLIQAILDIAFTWKVRCTMDLSLKLKQIMKVVAAVIWIIVLPVCYASSRTKYTCHSTHNGDWLGEWCISSYMIAVAFYMVTNAIEMVLFFVPAVKKYIETSNCHIFTSLSWWTEPRLYIGRGMQENQISLFNYNLEIKPLIAPTRQILGLGVKKYDWHELVPEGKPLSNTRMLKELELLPLPYVIKSSPYIAVKSNAGAIVAIWAPIVLVSGSEKSGVAKFVIVWNQIIRNLRQEDLISNREMDMMTMPLPSELFSGLVRWPVFLLANKFSTALSIARDFEGNDEQLLKRLKKDKCMYSAVKECYELLKHIMGTLVVGDLEKRIIDCIIKEIEASIESCRLLKDFKLSELPNLQAIWVDLLELLVEGNEAHHWKVVNALQDIFELVTNDMMINNSRIFDLLDTSQFIKNEEDDSEEYIEQLLFVSDAGRPSVSFPLPDNGSLADEVRRLLLLLTIKDIAMDIPSNLEARRRILFFATSLFMDMPHAPKVRNMLSFSVLTPHYMEEVNFSKEELHLSQQAVSILFYMQRIYPDEWKHFLERMGCGNSEGLYTEGKVEDLRNWASFRGQTLSRTVRGMMYYRQALKLQAFLDMADDEDIIEGYDAAERENHTLSAQLDALADLKFTYIVSCQMFGSQKSSGHPQARDMLDLMSRQFSLFYLYPSLRIAYVEEKEEIVTDKPHKVYSSVLVKDFNGLDQEIYRIKLPGPPNIGEGKPENQNHAIIFTRGEALQAIDMNQDNYLEEAFKVRNILEEFLQHQGQHPPTILGLREHIFTGSLVHVLPRDQFCHHRSTAFGQSSEACDLSLSCFKVRFHYGHPDFFDRIFHMTRGGISKGSRTINLSEDVFAGFNTALRRGHITYLEYMQVGKGRDVGLNQISKFEAKITNGNSEQTLSRDIFRLGRHFDFFRMLSCYFTTIGFYFNIMISVIGIYVFLYGQLYLILSGLEKALIEEAEKKKLDLRSLQTALASQSFIQLGLLTGLPMVMELGLEKGFLTALKDFILMQLQLAAVFFTFSMGTKCHYYGRTLLHGGAKYRPTGRQVVVFHASFTENYRLYSRSHFVKGFELLLLLIVYDIFRHSYQSSMTYVVITYPIWFMSITWLFAPFLFNPSGFNWEKVVEDWKDWNKWISQQGGIGIQQDKSWESWWNDEQAHLRNSGLSARIIEVLLSVRFFMYQYGLVYHLDISQQNKNVVVYLLSWVVLLAIFLLVKAVNMGRQLLSARYQLAFRLFKAFLFLGVLSIIITLSLICDLSSMDLIVCCLAFFPTGWGLILIAQAVRPKIEDTGLWEFVEILVRAYDYGMGVVLFTPVAVLAWMPIISAFQTRFLFNEAFNRHLQIQTILQGKKKYK